MFVALYNRAKALIHRQPAGTGQKDVGRDILPYFQKDNAWPLKHAKAIQDSETAVACLDTVVKFTRGAGFSQPELEKIKANKEQNFWEFHLDVVKSWRTFKGYYINVKYNRKAEPVEWYVLPFENCRLGVPDDRGYISCVVYNPFFGVTLEEKRDKDKKYYTFNPDPEVVQAQMAEHGRSYPGQVFYFGETTAMSRFYPRPKEATVHPWMNIEAAIATFHEENLEGGMFQSVLMRMIGDPNADSQHPDDQEWNESQQRYISNCTVGERFNKEMQSFTGADRVAAIMVQWAQKTEEWPDLQPFPTNNNTEIMNALSDRATKKITLGFNVPPILAGITEGASLGGDGNQVRVAVKLMQSWTADDQKTICMHYSKIGIVPRGTEVSITPYNPFPELEVIDKQTWEALSLEERRLWIEEKTPYKLIKTEPAPTAPQAPQQAKISNVLWTDYPEKARENAKKALNWADKCPGTKMGRERSQRIMDGMPLSFKEVQSIYRWMVKNAWAKDKIPGESCDAVLYLAWGGEDMEKWAGERIKSIM